MNRANARASTGPTSVAGKAAVARNALRHGLAAGRSAEPRANAEAAELARAIAGPGAGAERLAAALGVAEAQVDLRRVRSVRTTLLDRVRREIGALRERTLTSPASAMATVSRTLRELEALGRYESRALTCRKRAIRVLAAVRRRETDAT